MLKISLVQVHLEGNLKRGHATLMNLLNPSPSTNLIGNSYVAIVLANAFLIKSWSNFHVPITPILDSEAVAEALGAGSKVKSYCLLDLSTDYF